MKTSAFYQMFLELLNEVFDAENQIVTMLPQMIQSASSKDLKEALSSHLAESKEQVTRLKKVFSLMNEQPAPKTCKTVQGIIQDAQEGLKKQLTPAVKDAFMIVCAQKVEHYEIALYGSVCTLATHFEDVYQDVIDFDEIGDLLKKTLNEESKADKKLTTLAEGKFFAQGINDEAEKELKAQKR